MINLNQYILEKFKISKKTTLIGSEDEKILIDLLQLKDDELISHITTWFNKYDVKNISLQVNEKYLSGFKKNISQEWDGHLNQEIFTKDSFICSTTDGNFDIMKWIINGSHDYSKLINILIYRSSKDTLNLYGSEHGLYIQHKDYEIIILIKHDEKSK